jgi:dTDP-4-amino-4,6-dideoxygalactose transaminase
LSNVIDHQIELSRALCATHQRSHCCLVGSATIGLVLALKAIGVAGKPVAVPNSVCLNVPLAVIFAGGVPIYCDIDSETLGLSPESLRDHAPTPIAVIAVHAYGAVCRIREIADFCRKTGAFLVEDLAVAQGAMLEGQPVGTFGDCAVMSFGAGKIIDAGRGGAVLTNDRGLAEAIDKLHAALRPRTNKDESDLAAFNSYHTSLYNRHYGLDLDAHAPDFLATAVTLKEAFLSRATCGFDIIAEKLRGLADNIARRARLAEMLHRAFSEVNDHVIPYVPPSGSVYWRFNLFLRVGRDRCLKTLLTERFLVSSWYPSASLFLGGRSTLGSVSTVSDRVGDEILNLWVNEQVDEDYVVKISDRINQLMRETNDKNRNLMRS